MEWDTSDIIETNGTFYRIGWDKWGYFSIQTVEENPHPDENDLGDYIPATDQYGDAYPVVSFDKAGAVTLAESIEERL